ncbi:uncharacterized protein EI90DRAFT_2929997 [Cantharellus anzutake]|uniref:uncharacterized protein n=1 Tax=Cantharellus anzutake TaxID=1750568 RepID=UPI001908A94D|nr:uncharacterized protein EI90DRAFT_2929997 [Cantharellus anzutake]KAF8326623.1 hypothetical protein EI90DRAFT_2929997 [Cantharellus anzutake]
MLLSLLGLLAFCALAQAHFTLDFPYTRGFNEDKEPTPPCGGYGVNGTRTPFPLNGGFISYSSFHAQATTVAGISFLSNPTSLKDFNTTTNGTTYPLLVPQWNTTTLGSYCVHVNVASLGLPIGNGQNATIVVVFNGGDGVLYQCSDVVLLSNYTIPSSISCTSVSSIIGGSTTASPSGTKTSTSTSTSKQGAAVVEAPINIFLAVVGFVGSMMVSF